VTSRPAETEVVPVRRLAAGAARRLEAAPRRLGRVHSVFERAVNVLCDDERLLALHGPGPLAAPFAVALDQWPPSGALAPGMAVERMGGRLALDGLAIDWRGAEVVETALAASGDASAVAAALLAASLPPGAAALRSPAALEARRCLAGGIRRGDVRGLVEGALRLIGLGEGLTPAGDDCLVGALAVVHRFRPGLLADHPGALREIAAAAREGTTVVAREFLFHALEGRFSEAVVGLASAPTEAAARDALADLLTMGATSGADTAAGMRLGLEALGA
jgi:hypothetical protein